MITPTSLSGTAESSRSTAGRNRHPPCPEKAYDAELVRRFVAGDETAFEEIVLRYRSKIHAAAFALIRNQADAEEIVQDTFIRAHRNLAGFRGDCSLSTWLHLIACNLGRNRYWYFFKRGRHVTQSLDCAVGPHNGTPCSELVASDAPTPAHEATMAEMAGLIELCLTKLSDSHREIITLRSIRDRSYCEIGRSLGLNTGTVKSRLARARESLRALLAEMCNGADAAMTLASLCSDATRSSGHIWPAAPAARTRR